MRNTCSCFHSTLLEICKQTIMHTLQRLRRRINELSQQCVKFSRQKVCMHSPDANVSPLNDGSKTQIAP